MKILFKVLQCIETIIFGLGLMGVEKEERFSLQYVGEGEGVESVHTESETRESYLDDVNRHGLSY